VQVEILKNPPQKICGDSLRIFNHKVSGHKQDTDIASVKKQKREFKSVKNFAKAFETVPREMTEDGISMIHQ
jgi:hypothetical protein